MKIKYKDILFITVFSLFFTGIYLFIIEKDYSILSVLLNTPLMILNILLVIFIYKIIYNFIMEL